MAVELSAYVTTTLVSLVTKSLAAVNVRPSKVDGPTPAGNVSLDIGVANKVMGPLGKDTKLKLVDRLASVGDLPTLVT